MLERVLERLKNEKLNGFVLRRLADLETPMSMYLKVRYAYGDGPSFLLESAEQHEKLGRYSFIGAEPFLTVTVSGQRMELRGLTTDTVELGSPRDVLHALSKIISAVRNSITFEVDTEFDGDERFVPTMVPMALVLLGYESVKYFEKIAFGKPRELGFPEITLVFPSVLVMFDNYKRLMWNVLIQAGHNFSPDVARRELSLLEKYPLSQGELTTRTAGKSELRTYVPKSEFCEGVERIKRYIHAGDAFQVVYSQRFAIETSVGAVELYRRLRYTNPSPYMFLIQTGEYALFGSSPETLVKVASGKVVVHPIAGTRRRGATAEEDEAIERELLADEKELAEHSMLVDLARNDVGRVARAGTVRVPRLMYIERYSHVMHIVSEVVGELRKELGVLDALAATFPAGTVTGAPKVRAMEIIEEVEGVAREFYAGTVGYISWAGDGDFAITIRSGFLKDGKLYTQAGAGIVYDSVPENEYQETINKATALLRVAGAKIDGNV